MAQHTPVQFGATRVPMMDGAALDARTRPLDRELTPVGMRLRLQARRMRAPAAARSRAREFIDRLAGRTPS